MLQPLIRKAYSVELNMPTIAVGQRYTFQDVPQLRGGTIFVNGVSAFSASGLTVTSNQKNVVTAGGALNVVVYLVVGETEDIFAMPYSDLISQLNGGLIRTFENKQINLVKSYCVLNSITGVTAGESLFFNFYYKDAKERNV